MSGEGVSVASVNGAGNPRVLSGNARGLGFRRFFTTAGENPLDNLKWETRASIICNDKSETIFEQKDVEVPEFWSQTATNIVASKYFSGNLGTAQRETSVRQLIERVALTIVRWGAEGGYFDGLESKDAFRDELIHLLVNQMMSFNSPVWFNVGVQPKPQCSACFINSVEDSLPSIFALVGTEGMLFKWGSGTGTNFSRIRGSRESLSGGGVASGPISFLKGFDAFAGAIKSGGKTRRAAKMVILNIDHPDIVEFIECKNKEERKAHALIEQGYQGDLNGEAYSSIFFQNANHSVRVTDDFMRAVEEDEEWWTTNVTDGSKAQEFRARDLLRRISESAWHCGDPGLQYDTATNLWHTCKNTERINASNPCSEYVFLDDTACNLASLNLMKYMKPSGEFDVDGFRHAVDITITAQEILVDNASYPTPKIAENSHNYRPLGLGYANLGALLMSMGLPYDSDSGRNVASLITSLMCGEAYAQSSRLAESIGSFAEFNRNRSPMIEVILRHQEALTKVASGNAAELHAAALDSWNFALGSGGLFGYRNAQVTVLAPTGTIGFMMDCDTTGIEPDLALVKIKKLVGGGRLKLVNATVPRALERLGYTAEQSGLIVSHLEKTGTIEDAPDMKPEHLPVFDCSLPARNDGRSISWSGHLKMMAAAQPFLSGAISKTINMPETATVDEIMAVYVEAWRLGLKAVAVYRNNAKRSQPMSSLASADQGVRKHPAAVEGAQSELFPRTMREELPATRGSVTHKFVIGGHTGFITSGLYPDDRVGEVFLKMSKEGSTLSGVMDGLAITLSIALQYGVPLRVLVDNLLNTRFDPSGITDNKDIRFASSVLDYVARWLGGRFISADYLKHNGSSGSNATPERHLLGVTSTVRLNAPRSVEGAPTCSQCGMLMVFGGSSCWRCENCGSTTGACS